MSQQLIGCPSFSSPNFAVSRLRPLPFLGRCQVVEQVAMERVADSPAAAVATAPLTPPGPAYLLGCGNSQRFWHGSRREQALSDWFRSDTGQTQACSKGLQILREIIAEYPQEKPGKRLLRALQDAAKPSSHPANRLSEAANPLSDDASPLSEAANRFTDAARAK